jgi:nucleotide-binding universal stress UspA family protein
MSHFDSILLPLDGSPESAKAVGCAVWLADRLGATLHVLHSTPRPIPSEAALERLGAGAAQRARTVLHQIQEDPMRAVLDTTAQHAVELVVMSARGITASAGIDPDRRLGRVATVLIENSKAPVLLIPLHYRESLPWHSMLVASSGEHAADQALTLAVQLATRLQLKVSAVYVEEARPAATDMLAAYADAPQHEYPRRLEEIVRRALECSPAKECSYVDEVRVRRGDPATELLAEIASSRSSMLALGCHGALVETRAPVLKQLLTRAECPLLVVHEVAGSRVHLKVGDAISEL